MLIGQAERANPEDPELNNVSVPSLNAGQHVGQTHGKHRISWQGSSGREEVFPSPVCVGALIPGRNLG